MYRQTPKFRKQLTQNQLDVLRLLYRYRFASRDLIAEFFNKKDVYRQLLVLEDRGFIAKRYDPSYKLAGKPAAYYLTISGAHELLKVGDRIEDASIKKLYKAKQLSDEFVENCLSILFVYLQLRRLKPTTKYFTKIDLHKDDYSYFPNPLPDAYIRIDNSQYFLNYIDSKKPFFAIARGLKLLEEYYDNGAWDDTGTEFPMVVIVLEDAQLLKKLNRFIENNLEGMKVFTLLKSEIISGSFPSYPGRA